MNSPNAASWAYFIPKPFELLHSHERWRRVAKILKLSREARLRLEWVICYYEGQSATEVARRYGVSRKTFYKWFREFDQDNLYSMHKLEDKSRAPKRVRQREIAPFEEDRVIALRACFKSPF